MALIKKCVTCSNKGLSLKLSDGLCPTCLTELKSLEALYIKTLQIISTSIYDKDEIKSSLKEITLNLSKFKDITSTIKLDDCISLLSSLDTIPTELKEDEAVLLAYSVQTPIQPVSNEIITNKDNNSLMVPSSNNIITNEENCINDNFETGDLIIDDYTNIDNSSLVSDNSNSNKDMLPTDEKISDINNLSSILSDEQLESIKPIESNESSIEHSNSVIKNNLYVQTSQLITKLKNNQSSLEELAENLFLLKNTYLPVLNEYSLSEVDDTNIQSFISEITKMLTVRTKQKEENLYSYYNYIAYSIQTNGIRPYADDIIEISALKIRYGKIVDKFYTLINPMKSIEKHVEYNTGISTADVEIAPTIDIALPEFLNFTDGLKLICHNSRFMSAFLNNKHKILYNKELPNKIDCTMDLYRLCYRSYYGEPAKNVDMLTCVSDVLTPSDVDSINSISSLASATAFGTYKLYEQLKYKYK